MFGARLRSTLGTKSHAAGSSIEGRWLRTGDLGVYLEGELYITGRMADLVFIDGRSRYPQDIEATVADASPMVRKGYAVAFAVPTGESEGLVIIAERAAGTASADPQPAVEAIKASVSRRHGISPSDVRFVPAGAIPRTTSGKLARCVCRAEYLDEPTQRRPL